LLFLSRQSNLYTYVNDNPIDAIDPKGRSMCDVCAVAVASWFGYCSYLAFGTGPGAVATAPICAVGAAVLAVHNCLAVCEDSGDLDPPQSSEDNQCSTPDAGISTTPDASLE
jgi:hypothetical protein